MATDRTETQKITARKQVTCSPPVLAGGEQHASTAQSFFHIDPSQQDMMASHSRASVGNHLLPCIRTYHV